MCGAAFSWKAAMPRAAIARQAARAACEPLVGADQALEHGAYGVVGVPLDAAVGRPAVERLEARHQRSQGR